jgi:hypothetical protein
MYHTYCKNCCGMYICACTKTSYCTGLGQNNPLYGLGIWVAPGHIPKHIRFQILEVVSIRIMVGSNVSYRNAAD